MGLSGRSFILLSSRSFHLESTLPHIRKSKTVLDSGFYTVDSGLQVVDSLSVDLGSQIPMQSTPDNSNLQGKLKIRLELWAV